jgi:hypothetical protein
MHVNMSIEHMRRLHPSLPPSLDLLRPGHGDMLGRAGGRAVVEVVEGREGGRDDEGGVDAEGDGGRGGTEDEETDVVSAEGGGVVDLQEEGEEGKEDMRREK